MTANLVVLGGGFRGLVTSFRLLEEGYHVTLIESSKHCGGVLRSVDWDGFFCDLGCHLFDNTNSDLVDVVVRMAGGPQHFRTVDVRYRSIFNKKKTNGMAVVDLSTLGEKFREDCLKDFAGLVKTLPENDDSLEDALRYRYGKTIGDILVPIAQRVYANQTCNLCYSTIEQGLFKRVRIAESETTNDLRRDQYLDQILASPIGEVEQRFDRAKSAHFGRNFYPKTRGMYGFVEQVIENIKTLGGNIVSEAVIKSVTQRGSKIILETAKCDTIAADKVFSTLPTRINEHMVLGTTEVPKDEDVPLILFLARTHISNIGQLTYVHNFDPSSLVFRSSSPGAYSTQIDQNGLSYICAECPVDVASATYQNTSEPLYDVVQTEMIDHGMLKAESEVVDWKVVKTPKSITLPSVGSHIIETETKRKIEKKFPNFICMNNRSFSKNSIIADVENTIEAHK